MITKLKGMYDIYGANASKFLYIKQKAEYISDLYNYKYIKTPVMESSELFHRSVGESSDIVMKETYNLTDRANRSLTLRPEGTAGIVRSYIENKMYSDNKLTKLYYFDSMYRYERPQKGRNREFYQYGIEALGGIDYLVDTEVITLGYNFLNELGIKNVKVKINSLGDIKSKENYRNALVEYFKPYISSMCEDCQNRYLKNPLRILDCKVDANIDSMKNVPLMEDYLTKESKEYFENIKKMLDDMGIEYEVDNNLVRGLDYYSEVVFEYFSINDEGLNFAIGGGGRYNSLVKELGDVDAPAIGFGLGIDRLMLLLDDVKNDALDAYIIYSNNEEKEKGLLLLDNLRMNNYKVDMNYTSSNIKTQYKNADNLESKFYIIVSIDDIKNSQVKVKNSKSKKEELVNLLELNDYLSGMLDFGGYDEEDIY